MAKFVMELPKDILKDVEFVQKNAVSIFGEMTQAGAQVAKQSIAQGAQRAFYPETARKMNEKLKITKVYNTRKDKAINTKVAYYGYIPKVNGMPFKIRKYEYPEGVPAPFLAALREYGGSLGNMPEPFKRYWRVKIPFIRPAFANTAPIKKAMLEKQKELSKGILDD